MIDFVSSKTNGTWILVDGVWKCIVEPTWWHTEPKVADLKVYEEIINAVKNGK